MESPHGDSPTEDKTHSKEIWESFEQFVLQWQKVVRGYPHRELSEKDGIIVARANTPYPYFNVVIVDRNSQTATPLLDRMRNGISMLKTRKDPGWLALCLDGLQDGAKQDVATFVSTEGLTSFNLVGMAGDLLPIKEEPRNVLDLVRIGDEKTILDSARLNCLAYGLPLEIGQAMTDAPTFWQDSVFGFIGYMNGIAVTTATAMVLKDCIYLFMLATLPEQRRKGYAGDALLRALNEAHLATGLRRATLHATEAGSPIYTRYGYHITARFVAMMPQ